MVAAYICALSSSPTEVLEDRERISKSRRRGVTYGCIHHIRIPGKYAALDERLVDPWYLVSYYTADRIGYKGRTWYNIPVVIESRTNTVYTAPYKPRYRIRARVAHVGHNCSLSRKIPAREVELTGRGCFCDGCHLKHSVREAVPAKKYYYLEMRTKIKEHKRG